MGGLGGGGGGARLGASFRLGCSQLLYSVAVDSEIVRESWGH